MQFLDQFTEHLLTFFIYRQDLLAARWGQWKWWLHERHIEIGLYNLQEYNRKI